MLPDRRRLKTTQEALFDDIARDVQADESDWDIDSPVGHRGRKGKEKERPKPPKVIRRWVPSPDPEPIRKRTKERKGRNEEPIVISPDASDMGADTEDDEGMDVSEADVLDPTPRQDKSKNTGHVAPSPIACAPSKRSCPVSVATEIVKPNTVASSVLRHLQGVVGPYATPRTRMAQFFTPGNEAPVVLWLNVLLDAKQPMLAVAVRDGWTLDMATNQVRQELRRRGVGEGWPELLGLEGVQNPGCVFNAAIWAAIMAGGGSMEVGLVWDL